MNTNDNQKTSSTDYLEMENGLKNQQRTEYPDATKNNQSRRGRLFGRQRSTVSTTGGGDESLLDDDEEEVYVVRQQYGYLSILFSLAQTVILAIMMWQCGVAPLNINPMVGPYPDALSEWGAKNAVNILDDGDWWRLVTPILLHAGVIHLFCNIAVQLETGAFFEREWGSVNWLIIYLVSAVGSSVLSCIAMPGNISVGSSGAVMGLFGGKLGEVFCRACESKKTAQGRIGHQVRKEQLGGVTCAVVLVMAFSFIPYGKSVTPPTQNVSTVSLHVVLVQWIGPLI